MATEFLKMKWKKIFHTHDINKDNQVTVEDADLFSGNFARYHNFNKEDAEKAKTNARIYWKEWLLKGLDRVDEETFLKNMEEAYLADKAKFRTDARRLFALIMDIVDVNKDRMISEKEFEVMAKSTGFKHYDRAYMLAYPQVQPGYISLDHYLDVFVEFNCNHDKDNMDFERPRHFGFGLMEK